MNYSFDAENSIRTNFREKIRILFYSLLNSNLDIDKIDIGNKKGSTDYIDFITRDYLTTPIIKGQDLFGRYFLTISFIIDGKVGLQTFFQRYTDSQTLWVGATCGENNLLDTIGGMTLDQTVLIYNLITNGEAIIEDIHKPKELKWVGKKVIIYDEIKWKSARIIQKNFKIARYNPTYKLCHKIELYYYNMIFT